MSKYWFVFFLIILPSIVYFLWPNEAKYVQQKHEEPKRLTCVETTNLKHSHKEIIALRQEITQLKNTIEQQQLELLAFSNKEVKSPPTQSESSLNNNDIENVVKTMQYSDQFFDWLNAQMNEQSDFNYAEALRSRFEAQPEIQDSQYRQQENTIYTLFASEQMLATTALHKASCKESDCYVSINVESDNHGAQVINALYDYFDSSEYTLSVSVITSAFEPTTNTLELYINKSGVYQ